MSTVDGLDLIVRNKLRNYRYRYEECCFATKNYRSCEIECISPATLTSLENGRKRNGLSP